MMVTAIIVMMVTAIIVMMVTAIIKTNYLRDETNFARATTKNI